MRWLLLVVVITLPQMRDEQCRIACLWGGYDTGFYRNTKCYCADAKDYEVMTETKRLKLSRQPPAPKPTYRGPWSY